MGLENLKSVFTEGFQGRPILNEDDKVGKSAFENLSEGEYAYNQFQNILVEKMNAAIMAGIAEGSSIPSIVQNMRQVGIGETYKLTRIARTEITQIANEGRLRGYKRAEGRMGIQFKYSLIIGKDTRTCPAHQELDSRIPSSGMYLNELIMLQQEVGSKYRMNLRGHSLLHPNQRTSLVRIV